MLRHWLAFIDCFQFIILKSKSSLKRLTNSRGQNTLSDSETRMTALEALSRLQNTGVNRSAFFFYLIFPHSQSLWLGYNQHK